ncbi:MAG: hypothetical protein IH892_10955 [Planctomycetes bacterium]|nr:hypothetical protein [Planctomycetota bacterium]
MEKRTDVTLGGRGLMALLALGIGWSGSAEAQEEGYGLPLIEEIRVKVELHEEAMRLMRMSYDLFRVQKSQRTLVETGTWIQQDNRHYLDILQRKTETESLRKIFLSRDQASIWEIDPESGEIDVYRGTSHYDRKTKQVTAYRSSMHAFVSPASLGLYIDGSPLSHWLRPEWASIHPGTAIINGRPAWVVDIRSGHVPETLQPHRVWIDQERGLALQVFTFDNRRADGSGGPSRPYPPIVESVQSIDYVLLDTGEWIPVRGRIKAAPEDPLYREVTVDLQSIRLGAEAVSSGVFEAVLPTGVPRHKLRYMLPQWGALSADYASPIGPLSPLDLVLSKRTSAQIELLSVLRDLAVNNETSLTDQRFAWSVQIRAVATHATFLSRPTDVDPLGRPVTLIKGRYARKNHQHLCEIDRFSDRPEPFQGSTRVLDGETLMQAYHPERLAGVIDSARQFHWSHVTPFLLGMRLFEGTHLMQEVLVPEFALVHDQTERINGQESYVVDARSPSNINDYARIWIECASGTPLQVDHYSVSDQRPLERVERVTGLKWHPIGDYGWFPIAGTRIEYRLAPHRYERRSTILTDPLSIRDISHRQHARLFAPPFGRGAIVYDTFKDSFITIDDPAAESLTRPRVQPPPKKREDTRRAQRAH